YTTGENAGKLEGNLGDLPESLTELKQTLSRQTSEHLRSDDDDGECGRIGERRFGAQMEREAPLCD
ncbi:hypothetical protein U1Q18_045507, partial [Sarracenia purpurea var. burkii]